MNRRDAAHLVSALVGIIMLFTMSSGPSKFLGWTILVFAIAGVIRDRRTKRR